MNYLAHLYLAGDDSELLIGGLMGDFVKGRVDPARPAAVRAGILLHRRVDSFTDQHPVVRRSKARIDPEFRRYAGILVDLFFDHFLACDWPAYSRQPLPQYADQPRVLAEGVGLQHVGLPAAGRLRDDRRDVDPGVEGAGQQQRCHHGRAA